MHIKLGKVGRMLLLWLFMPMMVVQAQTSEIDSLERVLKEYVATDTTKVNLINNLAYAIRNYDKHKARDYADQAEKTADRIHYLKGKAASRWIKGITWWRADNEVALEYFNQALRIAEKAQDKIGICNYLIAVGNTVKNLGDIRKSDEAYERSLDIARELQNKGLIIKTLVNLAQNHSRKSNHAAAAKALREVIFISKEIGDVYVLSAAYDKMSVIYNLQGNYPAALEYSLMALQINEQSHNEIGMLGNLIAISGIQYGQNDFQAALKTAQEAFSLAESRKDSFRMALSLTNMGDIYLSSDTSAAVRCFQRSLAMNEYGDLTLRVEILTSLGTIYTGRKEFCQALTYLEEALTYARENHLTYSTGNVLNKIGELYFAQKQYAQAEGYARKALGYAEDAKSLELKRDICKLLSDIYAVTGQFSKAYLSHTCYKSLYDSVLNKESIRKIAMLESSYEYNKEKQAYEAEKANHEYEISSQRQIITFLVISVILVLVLSFHIYRGNKLKKKVLRLEIENMNYELESNQKKIAAATLRLVQKSAQDTHNVKVLEKMKTRTPEESRDDINALITDYKLQSCNSDWEEFELQFEKIHTSFYEKLDECYPTLTPNEKKLCAFLKLNLSNKQITQITHQSEDALKKARLRLRKKLELDRDINLSTFIQAL